MSRILVIEDDLRAQKIYINKLKREGFDVIISGDGKEGLFYSREKQPDLIILDIMLGGEFNGFRVLKELNKNSKLYKIPILVLTNLDSEEKSAKDIGATEYIVKSNISLDELMKKVKSYLYK